MSGIVSPPPSGARRATAKSESRSSGPPKYTGSTTLPEGAWPGNSAPSFAGVGRFKTKSQVVPARKWRREQHRLAIPGPFKAVRRDQHDRRRRFRGVHGPHAAEDQDQESPQVAEGSCGAVHVALESDRAAGSFRAGFGKATWLL